MGYQIQISDFKSPPFELRDPPLIGNMIGYCISHRVADELLQTSLTFTSKFTDIIDIYRWLFQKCLCKYEVVCKFTDIDIYRHIFEKKTICKYQSHLWKFIYYHVGNAESYHNTDKCANLRHEIRDFWWQFWGGSLNCKGVFWKSSQSHLGRVCEIRNLNSQPPGRAYWEGVLWKRFTRITETKKDYIR